MVGFEDLEIGADDFAVVDVIRGQFGQLSEIGTPEGEVDTLTGESPRGAKILYSLVGFKSRKDHRAQVCSTKKAFL